MADLAEQYPRGTGSSVPTHTLACPQPAHLLLFYATHGMDGLQVPQASPRGGHKHQLCMALLCNTTPTQLSPLTPEPGPSKREDSHSGPPEALIPQQSEVYTQCLVLPVFILGCTGLEHLRPILLLHLPWLVHGWWPFSFPICLLLTLDLLILRDVPPNPPSQDWPPCSLPGRPQKKFSSSLTSTGPTILLVRTTLSSALPQAAGLRVLRRLELR